MSYPRKKKSPLRLVLLVLLIVALFGAYKVFGPNTGSFAKDEFLYIHTGSDYEKVKETLKQGGFISDVRTFDFLAVQAKYPHHIHPGKYKISRGMSNYSIIRMLRSGRQTPVKLVVNKLRTKEDFIKLLSANLEADSNVLKQMLKDPAYLAQFGLDSNTAMCAVMPATYDFFWNVTADYTFKKIEKSYAHFWDSTRKKQAQQKGLTPAQAIIVASIVDEETNKDDEKGNIASVYLNRFKQGMKLQADPTVKFAIGDFSIRRITGVMLDNTSPYNTYVYEGLPPGPICTPSAGSIEAVLQSPKTDYLYFCAKEDFSGHHNFAVTYDEQLKNAHLYQKALDAKNIH